MPITRRDDRPDRLSPQVLYLWRWKWALVVPALIVAIGTFFLTYLLREEYVATGKVFVNRFPTIGDDDSFLPNPNTVVRLLESDLLLRRVRDEFIGNFGGTARQMPIEKFSRQFKVKSEVLQDTSVKKEVSPVLDLSVRAQGAEETRFLMDSWLRNFTQLFGNYATMEAVQKRDALLAESEELEKRIEAAEKELMRIEASLPGYQKTLFELINSVAPADPPSLSRDSFAQPLTEDSQTAARHYTQVNLTVGLRPPGLLSRLLNLRVEELMAENGTSTRPLEQVRAEQQSVNSVINDVQTSISHLQNAVAEATAQSSTFRRRIQMMAAYQVELQKHLSQFQIASSLYDGIREKPDESPAGADVRVLAGPVTPELKVWPRRTLIALVSGAFAFILSAVTLLALRAIRRAQESDPLNTEGAGAGT